MLTLFNKQALFLTLSLISANAFCFELTRTQEVLGRQNGFSQVMTNPGFALLRAATWLTVMGQHIGAVRAAIDAGMVNADTPDISPDTEVYVAGMRIWHSNAHFENGVFTYDAGIPPVEKRVPLISYPVGPVLLRVDAGARIEADIQANAMLALSYPVEFTSISASLKPQIRASAFVEGYAKLLVARAGVAGMIVLLDAAMESRIMYVMDGRDPMISHEGYISSLFGRVFAFFDVFSFFRFRWKRLIDEDLYSWSGYCDRTENTQCPVR